MIACCDVVKLRRALYPLLCLAFAGCPQRDVTTSLPVPAPPPVQHGWLWGVTVDDISNIDVTVDAIRHLQMRAAIRVVFDEGQPASQYVAATAALHGVGTVMGELLDSQAVANIDVDAYGRRAAEYLDQLGASVDIWEIGNEVNGDWLGSTPDVIAKVTKAAGAAAARGRPTALTFYYDEGCSDGAHGMFSWIDANVSPELRASTAYVLVSYYEDDCGGRWPDWTAVFARLAAIFPRAALGIGECGTALATRKTATLARYYNLRLAEPRFIGGFFWWYFHADMVPRARPLWASLDALMVAPR